MEKRRKGCFDVIVLINSELERRRIAARVMSMNASPLSSSKSVTLT